MLQSTLISPASGSLAAIVGTPPAAQRSAGDGGATPDSFAMALNQASSPPQAPPAPSPAAPARQEPQADTAHADAATTEDRPTPIPESATAARSAGHRKAAAAKALAADDKPAAAALAAAPVSADGAAGALATPAEDTPDADHQANPGDAAPDAGSLLAALASGTPAAIERAASKVGLSATGTAALPATPAPARNGATPAVDAASAGAAGAARRTDAGAETLPVAIERDSAPRAAPVALAAAPANPALTPVAAPLHAPSPAASAVATSLSAAPGFEGRLQASPGGAEFAPALGAQLNVFLRDGVQHARLHLHPAELGPLTVQIQLDGAAAQVRLAAEHPLTRQALEQAMPTLASTLRESGLTLTGGGVFEQPANPQPQPQQDGRASPGERTAGAVEGRDRAAQADLALPRATVARRGVVDLVA